MNSNQAETRVSDAADIAARNGEAKDEVIAIMALVMSKINEVRGNDALT